jgi:Tfp pilus assembly protein PilX
MQCRLSREEGWVVVTAIILMTIMLGVGLAVLASADTQSGQSRLDRARESSFNLAEGLMQAESVVLQNNWPNAVPCATNDFGCGYTAPDTCTQATAASNPKQCPDPAKLVGSSGAFSNVDQSLGSTTWKIQVRDDVGAGCLSNPPSGYQPFYSNCQIPTYYKDLCPPPNQADATKCWPATAPHTYSTNPNEAPGADQPLCRNASNAPVVCTWDANDNKQLWVRVDTTVDGRRRSMVALLRLEEFPIALNSTDAVNGGAVNFANNGNKHIVDATNSQIVVRCIPSDNFNGAPTSGSQLKTTVADVAGGNQVTIPAAGNGVGGLPSGTVLALGADSGTQPPYELLIVDTISAPSGSPAVRTITFKSPIKYAHRASDGSNKLELAPAATNANPPNNCESWTSPPAPGDNGNTADKHQLDAPWNYRSDPSYPNFMSTTAFNGVVNGLRAWTAADGCPTNWSGTNVYIKSIATNTTCTVPGGTINSPSDPHFIFVDSNGGCSVPALKLSSNTVFYGVIYMRNLDHCTFNQTVLQIAAGGQIKGGVAVDGNAKVDIGNASNSTNCTITGGDPLTGEIYCPTIKFDLVAFDSVAASGAAGLVQNTWRELAPGQ